MEQEGDEDGILSSFKGAAAFLQDSALLLALDLNQIPSKREDAKEVKLLGRMCAIVSLYHQFYIDMLANGFRLCDSSTNTLNNRTSWIPTSSSLLNPCWLLSGLIYGVLTLPLHPLDLSVCHI